VYLVDGRGWVCERYKSDWSRIALEPLHLEEGDAKARLKSATEGNAKILVVDRKVTEKQAETVIKSAPARSRESSLLKEGPLVLRSDSELWPKSLGDPRPITMETRRALQKLAKYYGRKVLECEKDLQEVGIRMKSSSNAGPNRKLLETHSEAVKKELDSLRKKWIDLVEKVTANVPAPEKPARLASKVQAHVAPVQVLGETWHCATLVAAEDSDEEWYLGPLRCEANKANEDLQLMLEACQKPRRGKSSTTGDSASPAVKKLKSSRDAD
jgi:hypothetical protein